MAQLSFLPRRPDSVSGSSRREPQPGARSPRAMRFATRLMAVALAAALVLPLAEGTQEAAAGKKNKLVTKTFSSSGQIDIPDAGTEGASDPYPSIIEVDAFGKYKKAKIKDVNLTLRGFSHTFPDNVDVMLARGNQRATVMSDVGFNVDANGLQIRLDDQAGGDLPINGALASGTFRPTNDTGTLEANAADDPFSAPAPTPNGNTALSTFKGAKPDGEWRLFVVDDFNNDDGQFSGGWKLEITAKVKDKKKSKDKNKD